MGWRGLRRPYKPSSIQPAAQEPPGRSGFLPAPWPSCRGFGRIRLRSTEPLLPALPASLFPRATRNEAGGGARAFLTLGPSRPSHLPLPALPTAVLCGRRAGALRGYPLGLDTGRTADLTRGLCATWGRAWLGRLVGWGVTLGMAFWTLGRVTMQADWHGGRGGALPDGLGHICPTVGGVMSPTPCPGQGSFCVPPAQPHALSLMSGAVVQAPPVSRAAAWGFQWLHLGLTLPEGASRRLALQGPGEYESTLSQRIVELRCRDPQPWGTEAEEPVGHSEGVAWALLVRAVTVSGRPVGPDLWRPQEKPESELLGDPFLFLHIDKGLSLWRSQTKPG